MLEIAPTPNDYRYHLGAREFFLCNLDKKEEMLWWLDTSERDYLFVYDDGSSITCLNSERFFLPDTVECISPVTVRNSRIKNSGIAYGFSKVYLDVEQFVNIIFAHYVESDDVNFEVREKKKALWL